MASNLGARISVPRPSPLKSLKPIPPSVPLAQVLPREADATLVSAMELEPELAIELEADEAPATERTPAPPECCDPAPAPPPSIPAVRVEPVVFESAIRPRAATIPAFFPYDPGAEPVELPMGGPWASVRVILERAAALVRALRTALGLG